MSGFVDAVDEVIKLNTEVIDDFIKEFVDSLPNINSPEKLIGKPYGNWTPQDLQLLTNIYGSGDNTPLQKVIFNREYANLKQLEQGV